MQFSDSLERRDKTHLRQLFGAAREYIGTPRYTTVGYFYRNKPEEYFEEVLRSNNVLPKILKDKSGDQRSPINDRMSGVFLGVSLFHGRFPRASPFGDTRVQIPIEAVFDETTNLYFTDFYCISSSFHYVTLVLTKRWSREDNFCKQHLIQLDVSDNLFLRMPDGYETSVYSTIEKTALMVEVFFTEPINLGRIERTHGRVRFSKTDVIGKGTSTWGGLRKNVYCDICNPLDVQYLHYKHATFRRNVFASSFSETNSNSNSVSFVNNNLRKRGPILVANEPARYSGETTEDSKVDTGESKMDILVYVFLFILIGAVIVNWYMKGRIWPR